MTEHEIKSSALMDAQGKPWTTSRHEIKPENVSFLMKLPLSEEKPSFISQETTERQAEKISREIAPYIMDGIVLFAQREGLDLVKMTTADQKQAWLWAVKGSKFNAVYFVSRKEAGEDLAFVLKNAKLIDEIGAFIDEHNGAAPIANYALHAYVHGFSAKEGRRVKTSRQSVLKNAIQGYDQNTLVVKQGYFLDTNPETSFNIEDETQDWHDLSHVLAASASQGAFGVKYHEGLHELDKYYRDLTYGVGMNDASGPLFSDGLLFTQLSKPIFERFEEQAQQDGVKQYSNEELRKLIAQEVFAYLGGVYSLMHPGIGRKIRSNRAIDPLELAVLVQNKRFERRAAEVESFLFVRGTPNGPRGKPDKDPMLKLTRSERIMQIASLGDRLLYFEARNLMRHRAHEDALAQFASFLLNAKKNELSRANSEIVKTQLLEDIGLLESTISFYQLEDLKEGYEINLYKQVSDIINARRNRHG